MSDGRIHTAHDLIDSIFSRAQDGVALNVRRISPDQLKYLRNLIARDEEGGSVARGTGGSIIWMPTGRYKYILTEDLHGSKHTLMRLTNVQPSECGRLF